MPAVGGEAPESERGSVQPVRCAVPALLAQAGSRRALRRRVHGPTGARRLGPQSKAALMLRQSLGLPTLPAHFGI